MSRITALLALVAVAFVGVVIVVDDDGTSDPSPRPRARASGLALTLDSGWREAPVSLTPKLVTPKERLSVGTFEMRPGGCAQLPSDAYESMRPRDSIITIMERGGEREGYPPRPARFDLDPSPRVFECVPRDRLAQQFAFRDAGRNLYAFVVLGSSARVAEAERILDSLTVNPR